MINLKRFENLKSSKNIRLNELSDKEINDLNDFLNSDSEILFIRDRMIFIDKESNSIKIKKEKDIYIRHLSFNKNKLRINILLFGI